MQLGKLKRYVPLVLLIGALVTLWGNLKPSSAATAVRRINAPHFVGNVPSDQSAILWFGDLNRTTNHANARVGYNDEEIKVNVHVFDRRVWYDPQALVAQFERYDGATVFIHTGSGTATAPAVQSFRFVSQVSWWESRSNYQLAYQGNGASWQTAALPYTTTHGWRGDLINDNKDDGGWYIQFKIPFSSLGMSGPPPKGTVWKIGLSVHDRDDEGGATIIPNQVWPEAMNNQQPTTWGELHFGLPSYTHSFLIPEGTTTIRNGLNSAAVVDAHVGGGFECGNGLWPDIFTNWGQANYAGTTQINIQNQWDMADWPCFSKYYVTFPLDQIPDGKYIVSAELEMAMFGNAGYDPSQPKPSWMQILQVDESWSESTLTWNNAPLAAENLRGVWVNPMPSGATSSQRVYWDVGYAVNKAHTAGEPLRLSVYSADGEYHSGKYFWSSEADSGVRPTLTVVWGELGTPTDEVYLPMVNR